MLGGNGIAQKLAARITTQFLTLNYTFGAGTNKKDKRKRKNQRKTRVVTSRTTERPG